MTTSQPSHSKYKYTIAEPYTSPRDVIKREDSMISFYFSGQVANWIVRFTHRFLPWVTPNILTGVSLVLAFYAAFLFSQGNHLALIEGVIFLNISFIFDCADGQLARIKGLRSRFGAWFDYHSDRVKDGIMLFAFAWGAQIMIGHEWFLIAAFFGIFFQFLRGNSALNRDLFVLETTGKREEFRSVIDDSKGHGSFIRTLKHSLMFRVGERIVLYTVFGLLNAAGIGVFVYAALSFLFATVSAAMNYKTFYKHDKKV